MGGAFVSVTDRNGVSIGELVDEDTVIYADDGVNDVKIIQKGEFLELSALKWKHGGLKVDPITGGFQGSLTLKQIRKQRIHSIEDGAVYVSVTGPLYGCIYYTGNYPDETCWRLYGITHGYA